MVFPQAFKLIFLYSIRPRKLAMTSSLEFFNPQLEIVDIAVTTSRSKRKRQISSKVKENADFESGGEELDNDDDADDIDDNNDDIDVERIYRKQTEMHVYQDSQ